MDYFVLLKHVVFSDLLNILGTLPYCNSYYDSFKYVIFDCLNQILIVSNNNNNGDSSNSTSKKPKHDTLLFFYRYYGLSIFLDTIQNEKNCNILNITDKSDGLTELTILPKCCNN